MSLIEIKPVSRKTDLVVQEFDKEILIYDLIANRAFSLNESSALIWHNCDGSKKITEIAAAVSAKLNRPISEDFVFLALDQLQKQNLIENNAKIQTPFENLSRREVIRKVGLASLVTLPLIASLTAPLAAQAQSACTAMTGRPNGCVCTGGGNCTSGCCGRNAGMNACAAVGLDGTGADCRAGCECASGVCSGTPLKCT